MQYDTEGNILSSSSLGDSFTYGYDSAGLLTQATAPGLTGAQNYDGDGQKVKTVDNATMITYQLRSTALDGKMVAELDGGGTTLRAYVYGNDEEPLVKQESGQANWYYRSPINSKLGTANAGGSGLVGKVEFDPVGVTVNDDWAVYASNSHGSAPTFGIDQFYRRVFGRSTDPNMACYIDDFQRPCWLVFGLLNSDSALACPDNQCTRINWNTRQFERYGSEGWRALNPFAGSASRTAPFLRGSGRPRRVSDRTRPRRVGQLSYNDEGPYVGGSAAENFSDPQNSSQLPLQQRIALDTAKSELILGLRGAFGDISEKCRKNVLDKLAAIGFTVDAFTKYLEKGNDFYDGVGSNMALSTATAPGQIGGTNLPSTVGDLFAAVPGITALTSASLSPARLTIFFRSSTVDSNPDSAYNRALLFHEGLHGYGSSLTGGKVGMYGSTFGAYGDYGLLKLFGLNTSGPTSQITKYIQDNCF